MISLLLLLAIGVQAQDRYFTKTGKIYFDATSPGSPESITAVHRSVIAVIDTKTGDLQFSLLVKGFEFQRALMQEHFNENYMESDQFPKSEFKGTLTNNNAVDYKKDGEYKVMARGTLILHGISKAVETTGKLIVKGGKIQLLAEFSVTLADYKISVPSLVADKLARTAKIKVDGSLEPLIK